MGLGGPRRRHLAPVRRHRRAQVRLHAHRCRLCCQAPASPLKLGFGVGPRVALSPTNHRICHQTGVQRLQLLSWGGVDEDEWLAHGRLSIYLFFKGCSASVRQCSCGNAAAFRCYPRAMSEANVRECPHCWPCRLACVGACVSTRGHAAGALPISTLTTASRNRLGRCVRLYIACRHLQPAAVDACLRRAAHLRRAGR